MNKSTYPRLIPQFTREAIRTCTRIRANDRALAEAYRKAEWRKVPVQVIGTFDAEDCKRIGIGI